MIWYDRYNILRIGFISFKLSLYTFESKPNASKFKFDQSQNLSLPNFSK